MSQQVPHHVRRAFEALEVSYDDDDLQHGIGRLHARARQRRHRRIAATASLAIAVLLGGAFALQQRTPASTIVLADGSHCTLRDAQSRVSVVREDATAVLLRVDAGAARFTVAKQHGRRFEVVAGDVTVHVVGTIFDVERAGDSARVAVSEGKVEVTTEASSTAVASGETWMKPVEVAPQASPSAPERASASSAPSGDVRGPASPAPRSPARDGRGMSAGAASNHAGSVAWRVLARSGDYSGAFTALKSKDSAPPEDSAEDLFLAADSARLSGHPAEALTYLTAVVDRHAHDARADLAAFTLGRIYLDDLHRPADAARSFATARHLAPRGELAEDALAREVEAWHVAGQKDRVRESGQKYLEAYPHGQRVEMVRRAMGSL